MSTMEWAQFMISLFAMMASVGASIAANVNANTAKNNLSEVKENNKRALRPFLVIRSKEIDLNYELDEPRHLFNWDTKTYDIKNGSLKSVSHIEMTNIGNGVAKYVTVTMNLKNEEVLLESVNNLNKPTPYYTIKLIKDRNKFHPDKKSLYVNYVTKGHKKFGNDMYDFEPLVDKKFLAVEKSGDYKIALPPAFLILYNVYFQYSSNIKQEDMPYLEITIEYEDIIGNKENQVYVLQLQSANVVATTTNNAKAVNVKAIFDIKENEKPGYIK